jgi:hypothetical protein
LEPLQAALARAPRAAGSGAARASARWKSVAGRLRR